MHSFESDYTAGARVEILRRLNETNLEQLPGYGSDKYCESAKEKIRAACDCPGADIFFMVGGTQTNAVVIDSMLRTELSSQSVFWGEAAAAPEAPAREGYTFTGWDADFSNIRKDLTVTAQYRFVLSFADVSETDWFCEDVRWAVENGIFQGVGNGLFAPEQALTRGQLVTVLYRMAGSPEPKAEANFRDVAADSYYAKAVAWANENGIVLGMGDGTFDPDSAVTREQMVTIFFRYAKFCGVKTEAGTLNAFRDAASVSDYAREAMGWAVKAGLVKGDGQDLMPKATASRAQAAAILHRFAAVMEK